MKNHIPKITVGLPVYNSGKYLRECIDSILCQTFSDFELLIIDDGSTDDSISIINSYTDKRIRFIKKNHDYIGTINLLLTETKGKYFARMDSDDVMLPQRLELQYKFMESHKDYDLVGGGYQTIGETEKIDVQTIEHVDLPHMIDYCCIVHPTVMIRKNIIKRYKLRYKKENIYAEDYGLWLEMLMFGLKLYNMPEILIQYRFSNNQVSVKKGKEQFKIAQKLKRSAIYWLLKKQKEVKNNLFRISNSPNLLTLVVPFYNEREEVYNTLKNARETGGMSFDIIVIDDCSDDGYDYQNSLKSLNIHYVKNNIRIGAAQSKEKGISMVKTPYFLLLDAHMRFYKSDWVDTLIKYLQKYDREILCCQTKVLKKIDGKVFECDKSATTFGANISFSTNFYMPYVNWCYKQSCTLSDNQIACVLGAGYATSTQYWNYLKGYQGLLHYGSEEAYISIKSWLFGNGCRLIPEIILGHIYRNEHPYRTYSSLIQYNYLLISKVLFPNSLLGHAYTAAYLQNPKAFMRILPWIKCNSAEITRLQNYYRSLPTQQFQTIIDMNKVESNRLNLFLKQEEKRLPIIIDYLKQSVNNIHHIGLKDGLMGVVLAFSLYADYYKDESTLNFADRIFESIYDTFDKEIPITFGNGACGIGWCILYLQTIGLLNKNMEDWLQMIDSMIMEREPKRIQDMSFDTGLGGIIQYVITRINYCRYNHIELIFDKKYLHSIKLAGKRLIHNQYTEKRSIMATMELLVLSNNHMYDLYIDLAEILNLPKVLPNDFKYWQANLNSATGYLINISNKINRLR